MTSSEAGGTKTVDGYWLQRFRVAVWLKLWKIPGVGRWLVYTLWCVMALVLTTAVVTPRGVRVSGWWIPVAVFLVCGAAMAALWMLNEADVRRRYRAALTGLCPAQQISALCAPVVGPAPTDPAVLAATMRVNAVVRRGGRATGQRRYAWLIGVWVAVGALQFVVGNIRLGVIFVILVAWAATALGWRRFSRPRLEARFAVLRRAAVAAGVDLDAAEADPALGSTARGRRLQVVVSAAVVVVMMAGVFVSNEWALRPCRVADRAIAYVWDNRGTLFPEQPAAVGSHAKYQELADQLHVFAQQTQARVVRDRLVQIAEAAQKMVLWGGESTPGGQRAILGLGATIADEERAVRAVCS